MVITVSAFSLVSVWLLKKKDGFGFLLYAGLGDWKGVYIVLMLRILLPFTFSSASVMTKFAEEWRGRQLLLD